MEPWDLRWGHLDNGLEVFNFSIPRNSLIL
jgi:hypothetical protein